MTRRNNSRKKHKSFSLVKKIGITLIIPIFLAIIGALIVLSSGWNYITVGINIGAGIFEKPIVDVEKIQLTVNDKIIYKPSLGELIGTLNISSVNMNVDIYQAPNKNETTTELLRTIETILIIAPSRLKE